MLCLLELLIDGIVWEFKVSELLVGRLNKVCETGDLVFEMGDLVLVLLGWGLKEEFELWDDGEKSLLFGIFVTKLFLMIKDGLMLSLKLMFELG